MAHSPPGVHLPPKPVCTYDEGMFNTVVSRRVVNTLEVVEANTLSEGPKNKYERLESRISAFDLCPPHLNH